MNDHWLVPWGFDSTSKRILTESPTQTSKNGFDGVNDSINGC
jgi:hypothetical protein